MQASVLHYVQFCWQHNLDIDYTLPETTKIGGDESASLNLPAHLYCSYDSIHSSTHTSYTSIHTHLFCVCVDTVYVLLISQPSLILSLLRNYVACTFDKYGERVTIDEQCTYVGIMAIPLPLPLPQHFSDHKYAQYTHVCLNLCVILTHTPTPATIPQSSHSSLPLVNPWHTCARGLR